MDERWHCIGEVNPPSSREYVVRIADDELDDTRAVMDAMHVHIDGRVIRCRDCDACFCGGEEGIYAGRYYCLNLATYLHTRREYRPLQISPDGFCAWARPKEQA